MSDVPPSIGYGHPADAAAPGHYGFENRTPETALPLESLLTRVAVTDLRYDEDDKGGVRPCMKVLLQSADRTFEFEFSFPLKGRSGELDETLHEAQALLERLFRGALEDLKRGPLRLS